MVSTLKRRLHSNGMMRGISFGKWIRPSRETLLPSLWVINSSIPPSRLILFVSMHGPERSSGGPPILLRMSLRCPMPNAKRSNESSQPMSNSIKPWSLPNDGSTNSLENCETTREINVYKLNWRKPKPSKRNLKRRLVRSPSNLSGLRPTIPMAMHP